jgi:hypothetical protein
MLAYKSPSTIIVLVNEKIKIKNHQRVLFFIFLIISELLVHRLLTINLQAIKFSSLPSHHIY